MVHIISNKKDGTSELSVLYCCKQDVSSIFQKNMHVAEEQVLMHLITEGKED